MNRNSRKDVINNLQSNMNRVVYNLEGMLGCSDKGIVRTRQEDAILLVCHPLINKFKMLAVADGMGGLGYASKASNIIMRELLGWFESLPSRYFISEKLIYEELIIKLDEIDWLIRETCYGGGSTLALAIISNNNTILLNIGDSRIYVKSNSKFTQISTDHSLSWELFEKGVIKNKDDIRFHKQNNLITSRLGCEKRKLQIAKNIFSNYEYDDVYLFSDGVTDCVSDNDIFNIIKNSTHMNCAEKIIEKALTTISRQKHLTGETFYDIIRGGKDNATAAVLTKTLCNR